jgi:hypothetical protein
VACRKFFGLNILGSRAFLVEIPKLGLSGANGNKNRDKYQRKN